MIFLAFYHFISRGNTLEYRVIFHDFFKALGMETGKVMEKGVNTERIQVL